MKKYAFFIIAIFSLNAAIAQNSTPPEYGKLVAKGDSLYEAKDYKNSAFTYSAAFKANRWLAAPVHRYNAACSWALAGYPDSAFSNLYNIAQKAAYDQYDHTLADPDLKTLHNDKRWAPLVAILKSNKEKEEAKFNMPLVHTLDNIYNDDQGSRQKLDSVDKKYGRDSKEMKALWSDIGYKDSINLIKVENILDRYGWLGADVIGRRGNMTLFLVIQHADMQDRDKYLPMMREAVKNGKADGSSLALMEDRSALEHGKKQIYGSQIGRDVKTGKYYIDPIEDEANVDKRRAAVGLEPLKDYVRRWNIDYKPPVPQSN
jgi:hypothetical protein